MDKDFIPKRISEYREASYWEGRYERSSGDAPGKDGATYDWLMTYDQLKELLRPHMLPTDRILILGCGNSTLSEDLFRDGYREITNIDYSPAVIAQMKGRTADAPMRWLTMDMRQLHFDDGSFEVILDKGSLDAIWTDGGSLWSPSEAIRSDIGAVVGEILRTLSDAPARASKFISVSFGQPHFRLPLLERPSQWKIAVHPIPDTFYFLYVATKTASR